MAKNRKTVSQLLVESGHAADRSRAEALVMAGKVRVDGERAKKSGQLFASDARVEVEPENRYVSRGGLKLDGALKYFGVSAEGKVCADVGSSTGGFTDVLLQDGAKRVYAIDVGYGELAWKLRNDSRIVLMERTNVRDVISLPETIELATVDVSFISLELVLPKMRSWLSANGEIVALVKPQFEAPRENVGEGGIVRDIGVHRQVLEKLVAWAHARDMGPMGLCVSPILGMEGNKEFFMYLVPGRCGRPSDVLLSDLG